MDQPSFKDIGELYAAVDQRTRGRTRTEYDAGEQNAYGNVLHEIEERFAHYHAAGPGDICGRCGLHLYNDIHKREVK